MACLLLSDIGTLTTLSPLSRAFARLCHACTVGASDPELTMASSKMLYFSIVLYAICLMTPACFVDYELACLPIRGTVYVSSTLGTLTLYWLRGLLAPPSYSNHLSPALYSCYPMKLLYNMI